MKINDSAVRCVLILILAAHAGCASTYRVDHQTAENKYKLVSDSMAALGATGRITRVNWLDEGFAFTFRRGNDNFRYDLRTRQLTAIDGQDEPDRPAGGRNRSSPGRGRQRDREVSPDGKWIALCKDWNVVLEPAEGNDQQPVQVTTDGQRKFRYGTASWVYGEELDQREAMWWSPDSRKLVFYEFDERNVPDHYITAGLTDLHTRLLVEGYPKPGEPNPIANLLIYDLESQSTVRVSSPDDAEWYTYSVRFRPDGSEILFNRTNRRQNLLHVMAADINTGATRIVVTERQDTWQENAPEMRFMKDGVRFFWASEVTGYKQFELRHIDGRILATLTRGDFPVSSIEFVDEGENFLYYTAFSDRHPLNLQLHRVDFNGGNHKQITLEPLNHSIRMSPDGKWFITEYESADTPPTTALYDTEGNRIATLAESDLTQFSTLSLQRPEPFAFRADDGKAILYGVLFKPSEFRKNRKYPLIIDVYGGPLSQSVRNRFVPAIPACEYGFLIAKIDNRGTMNRGKAFEAATYMKLGDIDLKDQADGARVLAQRPYVDSNRVGIYGHSYGGYMSALALLKHPEVFQAAVAGGTVTDWRNYDTIYTERFMRTPAENEQGYDAGSCLKHANRLRGKLLLLHGMVDDNVHPNNVWQLVRELHKVNKPFEMMFYPEAGHSLGGGSAQLRWNFFRRHFLGYAN